MPGLQFEDALSALRVMKIMKTIHSLLREPNRLCLILLAFTLISCAGRISPRRIQDYTIAHFNICEVHYLPMTQKLVPQIFGMRRSEWILDLRFARRALFPHAHEIYDTYACLGSYERYARIHVCAECTTARTRWLADHPPIYDYDSQYVRHCDLLAKQFAQSYVGR